jgi:hypothetical protein
VPGAVTLALIPDAPSGITQDELEEKTDVASERASFVIFKCRQTGNIPS